MFDVLFKIYCFQFCENLLDLLDNPVRLSVCEAHKGVTFDASAQACYEASI